VEHNTQYERKKVYVTSESHAFVLVARAVTGFVFEAGFAFVFEAETLTTALVALVAAALTAGFLASAFLLESFFGFAAVVFLVAVAFFEETLGVAVFLTVGFETALPLGFLGVAVFLGSSAASLGVVFPVAGFFADFVVVFLGFSPVEDGFLVVVEVVFLVEAGFLFSFVVLEGPLYSLTFPDLPFGRVNNSPSPLEMARLKCAMFAAVGSRP